MEGILNKESNITVTCLIFKLFMSILDFYNDKYLSFE